MSTKFISTAFISDKILFTRGQKVMLDRDLAKLYGIGTRDLNKALTRNIERFSEDFMFRIKKRSLKTLCTNLEHQVTAVRANCHVFLPNKG